MICYIKWRQTQNSPIVKKMESTTLFIVLVAVSNAFAYNFQDSLFNHELQAVLTYVHGSRVARHAAEPDVCQNVESVMSCCGNNLLVQHFKQQMPLMVACMMELNATDMHPNHTDPFSCEAIQRKQELMFCLSECMMKNMNLMDESGNLKEAEIRENSKKLVSEDWQKQLADQAVTTCLEKIKNPSPGMAAGQHKCSLKPLLLGQCVWKQMHLNCPEDKKSKNTFCKHLFEQNDIYSM